MNHGSAPHSTQYLVEALIAARSSARARLHLFSLQARDHWQELESRLDCLQSRIEYEGVLIKASAADKVRELTESVTEFIREHTSSCSSNSSSTARQSPLVSATP